MSPDLFRDLAWLPQPPPDFSAQCRRMLDSTPPYGARLRALASYALNDNQLNRLAKLMATASRSDLTPLVPLRLGVVSNATVDFIVPSLVATAIRHGIALECIKADYDQVLQNALSPHSTINSAKPDAVLVAVDHRALPLRSTLGSVKDVENTVRQALGYVETVRAGLKAHSKAVCILQTIAPPAERLFGSFDRVLPGALRNIIDRVNLGIVESVRGSEDFVLDVAGLAETVGLANWHSPTEWNLAKLPFSNSYLPLYADHVARLLSAWRGRSRRVLILDLDNTVWGGVIGDDGLEGIQCAQGDPTGEAYLSTQRLGPRVARTRYRACRFLEKQRRGRSSAVPQASRDAAQRRAHCRLPGELER